MCAGCQVDLNSLSEMLATGGTGWLVRVPLFVLWVLQAGRLYMACRRLGGKLL